MNTLKSVIFGLLLAALAVVAGFAQDAIYRVGGAAPQPVELMSDGKPYFRVLPSGNIELPNSAVFTTGFTTTAQTFAAGNFTSNGDKTWTVESADVQTFTVTSIGKLRLVSLDIQSTTIGAGTTGNAMQIALPFTADVRAQTASVIIDNNTRVAGRCVILVDTSSLLCSYLNATVFTTATNAAGVQVQIAIQAD